MGVDSIKATDAPIHTVRMSKLSESNNKEEISVINPIETYDSDTEFSEYVLGDQEGSSHTPLSRAPYITSEQYNNFMSLFLISVEEGAKRGDPEAMAYYRELVLGYDMGLSSELEKLGYYYCYVQNNITNSSSFNEMVSIARTIMEYDEKDNCRILYSTPILRHDDSKSFSLWLGEDIGDGNQWFDVPYGDYLQFYNEDGVGVIAPLSSVFIDMDGNISMSAMSDYCIEQYVSNVSHYYADIMVKSLDYSDKFRDTCFDNLDTIFFPYFQGHVGNISYAGCVSSVGNERSVMTVNGYSLRDSCTDENKCSYPFMISLFTHEMGHVFANASSSKTDIDDSSQWREIWRRTRIIDDSEYPVEAGVGIIYKKNDDPYKFLREYAFTNPAECFAECVAEYYATDVDDPLYNPNDLKALEIDCRDYDTLYDYMDAILN